MKMSEGVEWALHCCLTLAWVGNDGPVPTSRLAAAFELPSHYLNKFLQSLVRAGIFTSSAGAKGGFQLAKSPEAISLLDVVMAIEGDEWAFRCTEIRQRGAGCLAKPNDFARPCGIAAAMQRAETAWRKELAAQTIADLIKASPPSGSQRMKQWYAGYSS
ncbi:MULTISPECIES: RrF2 family transcriptional regulator [Achromobacter]|jgi:Rrf2 family protein|uniref:Rrf2 family transcriptional regulator n=1 Tax=Alcaligenes xylosoxydans xylosoxydans TaxID=85698 RepID=A0A9X3R4I0_ALCXX|nr:Rrf2 family transcriptional regulator [Achromobacter xylosoxidans]AHC44718.1 putative transcriptional regulator of 4-carboxymuconolactone decarboxylase, Rrf2 family [Achromobacter xylosoxidans NBRC 15126 = ATCC 27061]AUZ19258.1 Rrf2 family transcriptional regulator [Achromobacter xylosoxidans]KAA5919828.1 Rrf2 family transcriptional regulator [Achromobacter xylosoxidans]KWU19600.1 Rrf2 family transcriptional regulator [Achromobacter xylosoxidans]MBK1977478.1 Rrf2 family transcriptional regu